MEATYIVGSNKGIITGNSGIYNNKINNQCVKYGRNGASNFQRYCEDILYISDDATEKIKVLIAKAKEMTAEESAEALKEILDSTPQRNDIRKPYNFEYRYSGKTKCQPDMMALMGAAFEFLGKKVSLPIEKAVRTLNLPVTLDEKHGNSLAVLDLNCDKKIDISEYAAYLLLCDGKSCKSDDIRTFFKPTGRINQDGWNNAVCFLGEDLKWAASRLVSKLYCCYNLDKWQKVFVSCKNNMIDVEA